MKETFMTSEDPRRHEYSNIGSSITPEQLETATWRTSSEATGGVEVAIIDGVYAVRKSGSSEPLFFDKAEWDAFVAGAKDGEFNFSDGPNPSAA